MERVHELQARIDQQEKRLAQFEAELTILRSGADAANELAESLNRMEHATRRALRNLYDPGRLAGGDLACLLTAVSEHPVAGSELQVLLRDAISMLKPAQSIGVQTRHYCCYDILALTYLEGRDVAEIMRRLSISRRQYYRDLKIAVRAVACCLFSACPTSRV